MGRGSLVIVGTGMRAGVDITPESRAYIRRADKVLYLVSDCLSEMWIARNNPTAESLAGMYIPGVPRQEIYAAMVDRILALVRQGLQLCVAFYGHPGVFVFPSHEAINRARAEGFSARMLPGISAEDRLFADLGFDPAAAGCQSYEATSFLVCRYRFDPRAALILWQIGALGDCQWPPRADPRRLRVLTDYLEPYYGGEHQVVIYEAARDPVGEPVIARLPLAALPDAPTTTGSTLHVPPREPARPDPDMLRRLDMT
jgi:hypothetical protein